MKNKKVIYGALAGNYDDIPVHKYKMKGWDYILFTDTFDEKEKNGWEIRPLKHMISGTDDDNTRTARWHKTNPHKLFPEYDYSVWIDTNVFIINNGFETILETFISKDTELASMEHPGRECIFEEIKACKKLGKDSKKNLETIKKYLKKEDFPKELGLFETNVLFRKHNSDNIIKLDNLWWSNIEQYSKRDQLSFTYVLWKEGINCEKLLGDGFCVRNHPAFSIGRGHKINNKIKKRKILKKYLKDFFNKYILWKK